MADEQENILQKIDSEEMILIALERPPADGGQGKIHLRMTLSPEKLLYAVADAAATNPAFFLKLKKAVEVLSLTLELSGWTKEEMQKRFEKEQPKGKPGKVLQLVAPKKVEGRGW